MIGLRVGESVREGIKCESLHFFWEIFPMVMGKWVVNWPELKSFLTKKTYNHCFFRNESFAQTTGIFTPHGDQKWPLLAK